MRLTKMLGLAALAAVATMAFLGASSASATFNSMLCKKLEHVCEDPLENENFHLTLTNEGAGGVWVVHGLSPLFNILCLLVLLLGEGLELGVASSNEQYEIHIAKLTLFGCGTNATHTNCEIKSLELPVLVSLLTEELENGGGSGWGTLTKLNGETLVKCNIPLIGTIDCIYEGAGTPSKAENTGARGMVTANGVALEKTAGSGFCSAESTITQGLLEPLATNTDPDHNDYSGPLWVSS